jgi:hypothetical protein
MAQQEWLVKVIVRADEEELHALTERIGQAICDADHEGPCTTPWVLLSTPVQDLDQPERQAFIALLDQ